MWMNDAMSKFRMDGGLKCGKVRKDMMIARQHAANIATMREKRNVASGSRKSSAGW